MSSIAILPDVCMLHIFDQLSLQELALVSEVCDHWRTLQQATFARRGIVTLLFGNQPFNLVNSSYFSYPVNNSMIVNLYGTECYAREYTTLDRAIVDRLLEKHKNGISVEICLNNLMDSATVTDNLILLLEHYLPTLVSLKLWIRFALENRMSIECKNRVSSDLFRIVATINRCSKLQHLTLDIHNPFTLGIDDEEREDENLEPQIELPVLVHLKEFYFYSLNGADSLIDSFRNYANSNRALKSIGLRNSIYSADCLSKFLELSPLLLGKFTHLNTHLIAKFYLDDFCAIFSSLVTLSTSVAQQSLPTLFASLANLTKLEDLRLYIYFDDSIPVVAEAEDAPKPKLESVKSISLYGGIGSHTQMLTLKPGETFPNLTELRIALSLYGCPVCGYEEALRVETAVRENCYREMAKPWIEQCPKLKEAYIFNVQIPLDNGDTKTQVFLINWNGKSEDKGGKVENLENKSENSENVENGENKCENSENSENVENGENRENGENTEKTENNGNNE